MAQPRYGIAVGNPGTITTYNGGRFAEYMGFADSVNAQVIRTDYSTGANTDFSRAATAAFAQGLAVVPILILKSSTTIAGAQALAQDLVTRYGSQITKVQLGNEPNGQSQYGGTVDPEGFTAKAIAAADVLRNGIPGVTIIGPGIAPYFATTSSTMQSQLFLQRIITAGIAPHIDAFAYHPYDDAAWSTQLPAMRQILVNNNLSAYLLYLTEWGRATTGGSYVGATEQQQADYVTARFTFMKATTWIGDAYFYSLQDHNTSTGATKEEHFGLFHTDWSAKVSAAAFAAAIPPDSPPPVGSNGFQQGAFQSAGFSAAPAAAVPPSDAKNPFEAKAFQRLAFNPADVRAFATRVFQQTAFATPEEVAPTTGGTYGVDTYGKAVYGGHTVRTRGYGVDTYGEGVYGGGTISAPGQDTGAFEDRGFQRSAFQENHPATGAFQDDGLAFQESAFQETPDGFQSPGFQSGAFQHVLDPVARVVSAVGRIASAEAFGSTRVRRLLRLVGVGSAGTFGTATKNPQIVSGVGAIDSAEAFGTTTVIGGVVPPPQQASGGLGAAEAQAPPGEQGRRIIVTVTAAARQTVIFDKRV